MDILPEELDNRIHAELRHGEQLIWAGQPIPGRLMRGAIPFVVSGLFFTAFAIFWLATASGILFGGFQHGAWDGFGGLFACFPLFGVPFVLIGLGMISSPYWLKRRAQRTCYALTDQRAIIWVPGWFSGTEVRSYQAAQLDKMSRRDYADGSGDLIFEEVLSITRDSDSGLRSQRSERGFLAIDNVREVEELIRRTLLAAK